MGWLVTERPLGPLVRRELNEAWVVLRSEGQVETARCMGEWSAFISFRCTFHNTDTHSLSNLHKHRSVLASTLSPFPRHLEHLNTSLSPTTSTPNHSKGIEESFAPWCAFTRVCLKVWSTNPWALYILNNLSCLFKMHTPGTSLVAQWLRIHLPMQGTRVRALVREDPTCRGATKPMRRNYWACTLEPASHNYWSPSA